MGTSIRSTSNYSFVFPITIHFSGRTVYIVNMSHRRRKKKVIRPQPPGPMVPAVVVSDPQVPSPSQKEAFTVVFEKVLTMVNRRLSFTDRIAPLATFVFEDGDRKDGGLDGSHMKAVSLSWRTDFNKEIIRRKIRDKAAHEGASAVILLTDAAPPARSGNSLQQRTFLLSGVTLRVNARASVAYTFDEQSRSLSFSEIEWLDEPAKNFFLDGIFPGQ